MSQEKQQKILDAVSAEMQREPVETRRLRLRLFREEDFPDFAAYILQKEQQRLAGNPEIDTTAQARELFDWVLHPKRAPRTFAILLKEEERAVGNFSLGASPYLEEEPRLAQLRGLSFSLVLNQDYWNRGLMTELLRAALDWTFTHTDLDYVNTGCFSFNGASRRVQEKAGLRLFARSVFERDGKRIPTEEMLLTRADWAADRDGR